MIIDAKAIILTLIIVAVGFFAGLRMVRSFALSIAQENHDANQAIDQAEEDKRLKQERHADVAAASAFAKVEPLLATVATTGDGKSSTIAEV
jgi:uncharacterized protein YpmB